MKTLFLMVLILLVNTSKAQIDVTVAQKLDAIFNGVNQNTPGYMIAVVKDNDFLFKKAYGMANLEHNVPINSLTSFNIASLSKQITAASIALLILEDKISLEDHVSDYLKDFPFAGDSTKIKHLVYMTSGINDYYYNDRNNGDDWSSLHFFNIDTAIAASYSSRELMYKPGTQWSYSNINYMLLTKIVEVVSGRSFSDYVEDKIFKPLGMSNSLVNDDIFQLIPHRASGYNYRNEENTNWLIESGYLKEPGQGFLQIHRNAAHYGGSGVYTSMEDFKLWISNFHTKEFGGQEFYNLMHHTIKFDHDKTNDAFGLVLDKHKNKDVVWYEGGDWGFSAFMIRFVESGTTIVCFSNLGTGNAKGKVWKVYDILIEHGIMK